MKKLTIGVVALVTGLSSVIPAYAFPSAGPVKVQSSDIIQVRDYGHNGHNGDHVWHDRGHYNGGNRGYRRHYDHDGNAGAIIGGLAAGAIIGGIISSQQPRYSTNSHVQYCSDRYRSYRAYDNTFQPNSGPRLQCR